MLKRIPVKLFCIAVLCLTVALAGYFYAETYRNGYTFRTDYPGIAGFSELTFYSSERGIHRVKITMPDRCMPAYRSWRASRYSCGTKVFIKGFDDYLWVDDGFVSDASDFAEVDQIFVIDECGICMFHKL